jgi:hypothetical protein
MAGIRIGLQVHMKRFIWFVFIVLLAVPVFAQDEGEGGGGGGPDGSAFNDEGPAPEIQNRTKIDPMADLKSWLAKASAPAMSKSQEKSVKSLYDRLVKEMRDSFKKQYGVSLDSAIAAQSSPRGRRGGAGNPASAVQSAEVTRLTDSLRDKVIASLRMDQQESSYPPTRNPRSMRSTPARPDCAPWRSSRQRVSLTIRTSRY